MSSDLSSLGVCLQSRVYFTSTILYVLLFSKDFIFSPSFTLQKGKLQGIFAVSAPQNLDFHIGI